MTNERPVVIICPYCGSHESAIVEEIEGYFDSYCHTCDKCGWMIGESEWQEAPIVK